MHCVNRGSLLRGRGTTVAKAAVHSKAVALLLLIYCFMYLPLFVVVLCWPLFSSVLLAGCVAFIVFWMSCYCT